MDMHSHSRRGHWIFAALAGPIFSLFGWQGAAAETPQTWLCSGGRVSVAARFEHEAAPICAQAARAIAMLAACGIVSRREIDVEVARSPFPAWQGQKAGEFDPVLSRIRLLPFAIAPRAAAQGSVSTFVTSSALHASVAAHEVAHAVFYDYVRHLDLPETAHEYVAYAVQLATLPVAAREDMLSKPDIPVVSNLFVFSPFLLKADPERFALVAFRHFQQPENGCAFLDRLVQRQVNFPLGDE